MATSTDLRANVALFAAGFGTFSLMYCVQPVMPIFSEEFGISPAASSLSLSLTTGSLAITILITGFMSESWNRKILISGCLLMASGLTLLTSLSSSWMNLLVARSLIGIALGGVPAAAMAYAVEEARAEGSGFAMGLYIGGTALGGMAGRVITGVVAGYYSWRAAVATMAVVGLMTSIGFWLLLPASRHFTPRQSLGFRTRLSTLSMNCRGVGLPWLYLMSFLLMGNFVTIYNYVSYRLVAPPYSLHESAIGAIFLLYLLGMIVSPVFGRLADRLGRSPMLAIAVLLMLAGVLLTTLLPLWAVIGGLALLTLGFFAGHSVASGWVGHIAPAAKAQAASLYLLAYYLGASLIGSYGGRYWAQDGWNGVVTFVSILLLVALAVAVRLALLRIPASGQRVRVNGSQA
ncbi:MAG: MFS transporter [Rhizobiales bacterium]|nr:MFS transporter [Hyphomicrobiales bacterium]